MKPCLPIPAAEEVSRWVRWFQQSNPDYAAVRRAVDRLMQEQRNQVPPPISLSDIATKEDVRELRATIQGWSRESAYWIFGGALAIIAAAVITIIFALPR